MVTLSNALTGTTAETELVSAGGSLFEVALTIMNSLFQTVLTIVQGNVGYIVAFLIIVSFYVIIKRYMKRGV